MAVLARYSQNYAEFMATTVAPIDFLARTYNIDKNRMRIVLATGGIPLPAYAEEFLRLV